MGSDELETKQGKKGRPVGSGNANKKLMRVIITPRQERLLSKLRNEWGMSESEHVRRALDDYLDNLIEKGELADTRPMRVDEAKQEQSK